MRGGASLLLWMLIVTMVGISTRCRALSCGPCNLNSCPDVSRCTHGTVRSVCDCCHVCRKGPGESCGGPWGTGGHCKEGLKCLPNFNVAHLPKELTKHLMGTCKVVPEAPSC
ncbi:hypothetical protein O3P69_003974 [Scylla paramamosain]|uniref:IGFBP N-terminal domain-containing protein n=1 Tax=Scylla paramamosain TaxID=85552 RepID=A0AAW0UJY3_SCYPA